MLIRIPRAAAALGGLIIGASVLTLAVTAAPAAAQSMCTAAQYKAVGKKYFSKLKCYSKAVTMNVPVDAVCLQTAEEKFSIMWGKAVEKGDCLNIGSEAQGEGAVDDAVTAAKLLLGISPATCSEPGSAAACRAYIYPTDPPFSACRSCCGVSFSCQTACGTAALDGGCGSEAENDACTSAINGAGCADVCCP
jgi:hypothetical protein